MNKERDYMENNYGNMISQYELLESISEGRDFVVDVEAAEEQMLKERVHRHIRDGESCPDGLRRTRFCSDEYCEVDPLDTIYESVVKNNIRVL